MGGKNGDLNWFFGCCCLDFFFLRDLFSYVVAVLNKKKGTKITMCLISQGDGGDGVLWGAGLLHVAGQK